MTKNLTFCQKGSFDRWTPAKGFTIVVQCATEQCRAYYFRIRSIKVAQVKRQCFSRWCNLGVQCLVCTSSITAIGTAIRHSRIGPRSSDCYHCGAKIGLRGECSDKTAQMRSLV